MQKLLKGYEAVSTYTAMMAIFVMMCLTFADTSGRYIFKRPITGAVEFTQSYLMVAAVFLSMGYAYRKDAFIRVTIFLDHLPRRAKIVVNYVNYFVQVVSILYGVALVIATTYQALRIFATGMVICTTVQLPLWPAYLIIPIGLFLMSLLMLLDLFRQIKEGKSPLFKKEEPPTA
jgi:TRAP-type C4-dicarboxylate transport system permease small subunit